MFTVTNIYIKFIYILPFMPQHHMPHHIQSVDRLLPRQYSVLVALCGMIVMRWLARTYQWCIAAGRLPRYSLPADLSGFPGPLLHLLQPGGLAKLSRTTLTVLLLPLLLLPP